MGISVPLSGIRHGGPTHRCRLWRRAPTLEVALGTHVDAPVLKLDAPVSFWGGIGPEGTIIATGALVAAELYDVQMPIVTVSEADYDSLEDGASVAISMRGDDALITVR